MRKMFFVKNRMLLIVLVLCLEVASMRSISICARTKEITEKLAGALYEFSEDSEYEISEITSTKITNSNFGTFDITGNMKSIDNVNGIKSYEISDGNVTINYLLENKYVGDKKDDWYLNDDSTKKVDGIELEEKIKKGAIIIQTSLDGTTWVTDKVLTNVAADENYTSTIYTSKDIQQVNGCFYKVIVVYSLEKVTGTSTYLFVDVDDKEYVKYAEVYQFYLKNNAENIANGTPENATPRKELGDVVNAGKDTGFSKQDPLDSDDPHYGWSIGTFFVNGYTRETKDDITGAPIFLKNVGDRVTLWFNLKQDINMLNGNSELAIYEDKNGYDQYFQTEKSNMRHGTLIIRYTDYEGVKHDPVIYTDYLAANAKTGANTKVELFEEGDYEVALDYEIVNTSGIDSYTDYRIFFNYSIRNGNCMVYPFDISTGAELQDNSITENGFKLDMAKSRYLTIDVSRKVLVNGTSGRTEDVRFNRPAKDGDQYKDEGIYTFNVHNLYTGEDTTKTIYVGTDPFMRAMSVNNLSIQELEGKIAEGYTINNDGTLSSFDMEKDKQEKEPLIDDSKENESEITQLETTKEEYKTTNVSENSDAASEKISDTISTENIAIISAIFVFVVTLFVIIVKFLKKKKKLENAQNNIEVQDDSEIKEERK